MAIRSDVASLPSDSAGRPTGKEIALSAAICTRKRPLKLRRALQSLVAQSPPPGEIIVVENAAENEAIEDLVREEFPSVRYTHEPRSGLDCARNRALREAVHEVVAFLDDDAVAEADWVHAIDRVFREGPRVGACTGRVEALSLAHEAQRLFEDNGGYARGLQRIRLPADARRALHGLPAPLIAWAVSVGSGCSMALRRDVGLALGGFDELLDRGSVLHGGGDHDMLWRVLQAGFEVVYEPGALARHEHRSDRKAVLEQIAAHQRALIAFLVKSLRRAPLAQRLSLGGFLCWRLLKPGVRLARRALGRDPLPAAALMRMWRYCWGGLRAYPWDAQVVADRPEGGAPRAAELLEPKPRSGRKLSRGNEGS